MAHDHGGVERKPLLKKGAGERELGIDGERARPIGGLPCTIQSCDA